MSNEACFVYITTGSKEEAIAIGRDLVEEKLAACVNIFDGMASIYLWEGEVEKSDEAVLIAKTLPEQVDSLTKRVKMLHSYDLPCIVQLPVEVKYQPFLTWMKEQIR
jgi:periplasmic divalent cation tolerance protein